MAYYRGFSSLISEIDILDIEDSFKAGISANELAKRYGMNVSSMCWRLRKLGLMPSKKRKYTKFSNVSEETKKEIRKKYFSEPNRKYSFYYRYERFFHPHKKEWETWKKKYAKAELSHNSVRALMEEYDLSRSIIERILGKNY